jgi:hypothetical protein
LTAVTWQGVLLAEAKSPTVGQALECESEAERDLMVMMRPAAGTELERAQEEEELPVLSGIVEFHL